jgi:hypothetical protein
MHVVLLLLLLLLLLGQLRLSCARITCCSFFPDSLTKVSITCAACALPAH